MLTARGWWCLFAGAAVLLAGVLGRLPALAVVGVAVLLWFAWEWLWFATRLRSTARRLRVARQVGDERGPLASLWAGLSFEVRVMLRLDGVGRLPRVHVADPVPFGVEHMEGATYADGEVEGRRPIELRYRVRCPAAGVARFEGLRVEIADLQGLFYYHAFLREPVSYRILPGAAAPGRGRVPAIKRLNQLLPPGLHRLRRPGSGSELLDLRDYQEGDPPRTIAWKVSARRDRLITKEFESEVPVRCTLFLDVSNSVRVPGVPADPGRDPAQAGPRARPGKVLDRLAELSAGVIQANTVARDLTGLCLFDERVWQTVRPARGPRHRTELLRRLADAAGLCPTVARADPDPLLPTAYALAQEVYPELLQRAVNAVPAWLTWFVGFPHTRRRWRGPLEWLHRYKGRLLSFASFGLPLGLTLAIFLGAWTGLLPGLVLEWLMLGLILGTPLVLFLTVLLVLFSLLASGRHRRLARMRKRLAAIQAARYGPTPGGLQALLEDDDQFSLYLQRFLGEHQVPFVPSLVDERGRYLLAAPEKVSVLARALLQSVGKGRDNELFVLLVDLLDLEESLAPLLAAVKVAVSRHHRVVLVCPWPPGLEPPGAKPDVAPLPAGGRIQDVMARLSAERYQGAFARLRRAFARLGVPVVSAADEESAAVVLDRMERLRSVGGRR
jgi:uncharacterized protein (DUF58 family)